MGHQPDRPGRRPSPTKQYPEQALRLGIQYADGRRARSNNYEPMPVDNTDGEDLVMTGTGQRAGPDANGAASSGFTPYHQAGRK